MEIYVNKKHFLLAIILYIQPYTLHPEHFSLI